MNLKTIANNFLKVSENEMCGLFSNIEDAKVFARIWEKDICENELEFFQVSSYEHEGRFLMLKNNDKSNRLLNKKVLFDIEFDNSRYLSSGIVSFNDDCKCLGIKLIDSAHKWDRRSAVRLKVVPPLKSYMKIGEREYPLVDISVDGVSFYLHVDKVKDFFIGQKLKEMTLKITDRNYPVNGMIVRHITELDNEVYLLGLQFSELEDKISNCIFMEVNNLLWYYLG